MMKRIDKKNILILLFGLVLSLVIAYLPNFFDNSKNQIEKFNEVPKVHQNVIANTSEKITYHKLYDRGILIGVISNMDNFYNYIDSYYKNYTERFPNTTLGLTDDLYIAEEDAYEALEDVDDQIVDYLYKNNLLGVKCKAIEFSTADGVYDIIYVSDIDIFYEARNQFLLNFISADALEALNNKVEIQDPIEFGSIDCDLKIQEMMTVNDAVVAPDEIYTKFSDVYLYFCYGREGKPDYYETVEGDTLQGVGYKFGDMTATQIKMLNPDIISSENQIILPGTKLNVAYYQSPITVEVTKKRLTQESVLPASPIYREDSSLNSGSRKIIKQEKNGLENILYKETWKNGVLQSGEKLYSTVVEEPVQGEIAVGTFLLPDVGTGNWGWPTYNPHLTCDFTCYLNHGGIDIQNRYNRWDSALAIDSGVVIEKGYTSLGGYFVKIDHNNGYKTYYGHMRTPATVEVGQTVARGDVVGPIGTTGYTTGPHVHLQMWYEDKLINPCTVLACGLVQ